MTRREMLASPVAALAPRPTKNGISLAAWSLSNSFFRHNRWKNIDLPRICREELGVTGLEFVNQFFDFPMLSNLSKLKKAGSDYGIEFVLIMIDNEGDMAAVDRKERMEAARMHRKWVDIAQYLGCHAVRCNLGGPRENWKQDKDIVKRASESFRDLLDYAKQANLNVVIENHGRASSDPDVLVGLMKLVNDPNFGTLPDFGNVNPGDSQEEVTRKLVPYAKGISVKAMWRADGSHPFSLENCLKICMDAGYTGYWGIESSFGYERGRELAADVQWQNEVKGVKMTREVIERVVFKKS
ncbi:MAG: sugar phosphate isomerase/epimerase [Bryobacterales bacterium]|nr:sugar phosphate isomerase/epimerase [Bryobacterales bacterium]